MWLAHGGARIRTHSPGSRTHSPEPAVHAILGGHPWGQDTHLRVSPDPHFLSTNSNFIPLLKKCVSPYPKQGIIPPLSSLECFENLCLSDTLEKHEKNFLNVRFFCFLLLLVSYRFAFGVNLRQPKIPNFPPSGVNKKNICARFSVIMPVLWSSRSNASRRAWGPREERTRRFPRHRHAAGGQPKVHERCYGPSHSDRSF